MATIALMIGGAILNATTFVGGSYLAKYLSVNDGGETERKRHDLALEKYQADWAAYQKKNQYFESWNYQRTMNKAQASKNFKNVDDALKYYNQTHQSTHFDDDDANASSKPNFSDYYKPSSNKKTGELMYVGAGMLGLGYLVSKWF